MSTADDQFEFEPADVYSDDGYYAVIPEWVLDAEIGALAVRLYAVLRRYADKRTMLAHPSRRTLAARLHVKSVRTVDAAVDELRGIGALSTYPRVSADGDQESNGYRLHRNPQVNADVTALQGVVQQIAPPPATDPARGGAADCTTPGAADCTTPVQPAAPKPQSSTTGRGTTAPPAAQGAPHGSETPAEKGKRKTRLPEDWTPSEGAKAWTLREFPTMPAGQELAAFRDYHHANGSTMVTWDAAWRTWCRNWAKREQRRPAGRPRPLTNQAHTDGTAAAGWGQLAQPKETA